MSKTQTIAKFAAVVAGFGLAASTALPAFAQTTTTTSSSMSSAQIAALQAQIAALQAQLSGSQTTMASVTFSRDLTMGSQGTDVTALQTWLMAKGFTISAGATGYFGAQTRSALAAYQAANMISPAAGYFGPITRAKVNASSSTTTTTTTTTTGGTTTGGTTTTTTGGTTTLSGGEGSLDNFKIVGATNTSLNATDSDTVYGFEFKANGSDLMVNRVDYDIYNNGTTGSTRPWNVFKTATLMNGNTTVATIDASDMNNWSEDGTNTTTGNTVYRLRFDGLKDVVKMNNTVDYYLMLSTQNTISAANNNSNYSLYLAAQGVRAVDAMGLQQYTSSSRGSTATVSVSSMTSGSLTLSTGSDNPQSGTTVQGNSSSQTSNVTLTTFTLQAKDADVNVYTLPVIVATTTATSTNIVRSLKLYQGSTLIDTESFAANTSSTTLKFRNLNVKIPAGTTQNFSIRADINSVDGSTVPEGSAVSISVPSSMSGALNGWDAENASGDQVTVTGSVTGNLVSVRSIGLSADTNPTTSAVSTNNGGNVTTQTGTFTFTFNVTSFGQDIYLGTTSASAFDATLYKTSSTTTTTVTPTATAITSTADRTTDGSNNYVIHSGQTKAVTVSLSKNAGDGSYYYATLTKLYFATTTAALMSKNTEQSLTLPTTYQTQQVIINS